jgi:hypothetical protein
MTADADRTIRSMRKITDFPFHAATYYADYGLDRFTGGAIEDEKDVPRFFEALFQGMGMPANLPSPRPPERMSGCSAFWARTPEDSFILGKNLDWRKDPVLLLRTRPENGYASLSMVNLSFCDLFGLHSANHSLLLSPYVPLDGMNEKGLVVSMLSVQNGCEYPTAAGKPLVGDFNIIRIVLDRCGTVNEAISEFIRYNIRQSGPLPIHYFLSDTLEHCVVELFDGKTNVLKSVGCGCITNFLKLDQKNFEKNRGLCARYRAMEKELEAKSGVLTMREAKGLLRAVSAYGSDCPVPSTIWSLLFSPQELRIRIRIGDGETYYSAKIS